MPKAKRRGSEIVVDSEGKQLRDIIEREYGLTQFAQKLGVGDSTLDRYLQARKLEDLPNQALYRIKKELGEKLIYRTIDEQLEEIIDRLDKTYDKSVNVKQVIKRLKEIIKYTNTEKIKVRAEALEIVIKHEDDHEEKIIKLSRLLDRVEDEELKIIIWRELAYSSYSMLQYRSCERYTEKIMFSEKASTIDKARAYHLAGLNYWNMESHFSAVDRLKIAYKLYEHDPHMQNRILNVIAFVKVGLGEKDEAKRIYEKQIAEAIEENDPFKLMVAYNNSYEAWADDKEKADYYSAEALALKDSVTNETSKFIAVINRIRFEIVNDHEDTDKAIKRLAETIKHIKKVENVNIKKSVQYIARDVRKKVNGELYIKLLEGAIINMMVEAESDENIFEFEKLQKIHSLLRYEYLKKG